MQMYDIVATGVLGLLVGFWSGRSIRWKMEETEETGEDREERKSSQATGEGRCHYRQPGERKDP